MRMVHQFHSNLLSRSCIAHLQDLQDGTRLLDDHYTALRSRAPTIGGRQKKLIPTFRIKLGLCSRNFTFARGETTWRRRDDEQRDKEWKIGDERKWKLRRQGRLRH